MSTWIKEGGSWKKATAVSLKDGGTFKESTKTLIKINGHWEDTSAMPTVFEADVESPVQPVPQAIGGNIVVTANGTGKWKLKGYGAITIIYLVRKAIPSSFGITKVLITKMRGVTSLGGMCDASGSHTALTSFTIADNVVDSSLTTINSIVANNEKLTTLNLGTNNYDAITTIGGLTMNCVALVNLDLTMLSFKNIHNFGNAFRGCGELVCISKVDTTQISRNTKLMFHGCDKLTNPDASARAKLKSTNGFAYDKGSPC